MNSDGSGSSDADRSTLTDGPLRLTYLMGRYPVLTETFIDREILRLIDRGVDLRIISIRQPDHNLSPRQHDLRKRVSYLLPVSFGSLVAAHATAMVTRPRTYFGTLGWLLTRRHPRRTRLRTLLHFGTGVYAAWKLRDRKGVHVHAHFADRAATVALVASRLIDARYSVTAHAREIYVAPVLLPERISQAAFTATCTEYNRRHLATLVDASTAQRILRLYHGLDLSTFDGAPGRSEDRERPLLLSVAQLWERKGLEDLVRACGLLRDRGAIFACDIVGEGPLHGRLEGLIRQLQLDGIVTLTGPLRHPAVISRLAAARAFVLPCVVAPDGDRDGIPNVILEAMASGLPVVSTPVSGIPEVVRDGETGFLVPEHDPPAVADALERLLADPELAGQLGEAGRAFVRREFDLHRNVDRLIDQFVASSMSAAP
ncbi:MAG: glycosyltransferase [Chloroflexota bacterium]